MKLLAFLLVVGQAAARKAPKKFESATELTLDAPALQEKKGDQLYCVAPPDESPLKLVFASITWDIEFKPDSRGRARAVSDDDFHEAGRSLVGKIIGAKPGNLGKELDQKLTQRVQGTRGAVFHVRGPGRALRTDTHPENDRQEDVLPRGEDGVGLPPNAPSPGALRLELNKFTL